VAALELLARDRVPERVTAPADHRLADDTVQDSAVTCSISSSP
jgi:hypothetical protein